MALASFLNFLKIIIRVKFSGVKLKLYIEKQKHLVYNLFWKKIKYRSAFVMNIISTNKINFNNLEEKIHTFVKKLVA